MGTRLYPVTQNARILEILADVPAGTMAKKVAFDKLPLSYFQSNYAIKQVACADYAQMQLARRIYSPKSPYYPADWSFSNCWTDVYMTARRDPEYMRYLYCSHVLTDVAKLQHFLDYGWGRVAYPLPEKEQSYGSTQDLTQVRYMLREQYWNDNALSLKFDQYSWIGDRANFKLHTSVGSVYLSELGGLMWC